MSSFKYVILLSEQDKTTLLDIMQKGASLVRTILRANILLTFDWRSETYRLIYD